MGKVVTLPFIYKGVEYYLLMQVIKADGIIHYHITAITEILQSKLYGSYVFKENNGSISFVSGPKNPEPKLIDKFICALEEYLLTTNENS